MFITDKFFCDNDTNYNFYCNLGPGKSFFFIYSSFNYEEFEINLCTILFKPYLTQMLDIFIDHLWFSSFIHSH